MSLVKQVVISSLRQAGLADKAAAAPVTKFDLPVGQELNLVQVAPRTVGDIFVHHSKTDQLMVVRGSLVLAILQNRAYQYIPLSEDNLRLVRIPPGVPHGVINLGGELCSVVNAVIRHTPTHPSDYRSLGQPVPYDLRTVQALQEEFGCSTKRGQTPASTI